MDGIVLVVGILVFVSLRIFRGWTRAQRIVITRLNNGIYAKRLKAKIREASAILIIDNYNIYLDFFRSSFASAKFINVDSRSDKMPSVTQSESEPTAMNERTIFLDVKRVIGYEAIKCMPRFGYCL